MNGNQGYTCMAREYGNKRMTEVAEQVSGSQEATELADMKTQSSLEVQKYHFLQG